MTIAAHRFDNGLRYRDEADPRQVHLTPPYILEPVRALLHGIDLDPCTEPDNPTGARHFYAPPVDGASQPWSDCLTIFVNPPYGKARERWVRKCIDAARTGSRVVLLIPAHPDTRIFHEALDTAYSVLFVRGRVKFGVLRPNRRQAAASHPSALISWNVDLAPLRHLGRIVYPVLATTPPGPHNEPERCAECNELEVNRVHHGAQYKGYHPFTREEPA